MALDTFVVLANQYDTEAAAVADYKLCAIFTPTSGSSTPMTRRS